MGEIAWKDRVVASLAQKMTQEFGRYDRDIAERAAIEPAAR
jgi:hypothetical protein